MGAMDSLILRRYTLPPVTRLNLAGRTLLGFITFNIGWWACALGAARGMPWLGPAVTPLFIGVHLYFSPTAKGEAIFFSLLALVGFALDTALIQFGLFTMTPVSFFAPAWLVSMWLLMGMTFESMLMLRRKPLLLALSGAVSGPLSYYFGEALKVLEYQRPLWLALAIHAVIWIAITPILFMIRDYSLRLAIGRATVWGRAGRNRPAV